MARFIPLTVTHLHADTPEALVVSLRPSDGTVLPFVAGQYLTFRQVIDGQELRRSYSLCSAPGDPLLQVAVKRIDDGRFSSWLHHSLRVGDQIEALTPMGQFHVALDPAAERHYLAVAVGSGITPILSILRSVLETEPRSRFTLIYGNRSVGAVMFREALEDLKNRHMARLALLHLFSTGQEDALFDGRLSAEKLHQLFTGWIPLDLVDQAFVCGPAPVTEMVRTALAAGGMAREQIKYELFSNPDRPAGPGPTPKSGPTLPADRVALTLSLDGQVHQLSGRRDQSLLDSALAAGLDLPFACKAGVCSTCRCQITEGSVEMLSNHALEDYEVARGYRLSCQSLPTSTRVSFRLEQ